MGIFSSKKFRKTPEMPPNMQPPIIPSNSQKLEDNNLAKMRRQLYNDAPTFILNNLLLSIQFFNNYEKDIADLRMSNTSSKENKINIELSKEQKHCLIPDTLHELIDANVCFQPKHGAAKYYTETLHTQRMLIAYDNIEVRNPSETAEYSSALDGPIYKCVIDGTELRGYVQLKLKEIEVKRRMSSRNNPEQIIEKKEIIQMDENDNAKENEDKKKNSDEIDGNNDITNDEVFIDSPVPLPNGQNTLVRQLSLSTQEMIKQKHPDKLNESEYTYNTITNHYTPKPLKQVQTDTTDNGKILAPITNTIQLPSACVTSVQVKVYRDKFEEEEEKRKLREKYPDINEFRRQTMLRKKRELYKKIAYLNSIAFCDYFGDTFSKYIGEKLGFSQKHIQLAMMQGAVIYIDVINRQNKHVTNYEVIPSLTSSWPDEAYEWRLRTRPVIQDVKTQTAYSWPTPGMISRVKSFPSYIYPIGYHPKRGENINRDLQWRLQFPVAERFLESHLHHAQIRCYLIFLTFFKSFIESKDIKLGLTPDHIRTHLFWECERDYVRWPENRLGEKFIVFLKNLRRHLAYHELPDYFIPTRNLFENIPEKRLMIAHRKIVDILENPVMYTLRALRNLKYRKDSFYPVLDYNQLYSILTSDNILELINPQITETMINSKLNEDGEAKNKGEESSGDELDPEQRWYRDAYRKRQQEKEVEKKKKERKRRISCDSINIEIQPVRVMEIMRQMLILKLFISHFIEMARKSNDFNNPQQGLMYLQQAKNLNILLSEMVSGQEDGIEYSAHISKVEQSLKITLAQEENLPKIPAKKVQLHSYRITKTTDIVNEPKASTTSSDYVNVEQIIEKSKSIEDEPLQKRLDYHQINNMETNQNKFIEKNIQKVTTVQVEEFTNETIEEETVFENQIEVTEHSKIDIKQNEDEIFSDNTLTVQVDVHTPNKKGVIFNKNNSISLKSNNNEESNQNNNNNSKIHTKIIQDGILNPRSNKILNEINNDITVIGNHSNQQNLEISDHKKANKNNQSRSFSEDHTANEIKCTEEEIILNNDYLTRLTSKSNKRMEEVNQEIVNEITLEHKRSQEEVTLNDVYVTHLNSKSNKSLNEISQNAKITSDQNSQKQSSDIFNELSKNNTSISTYNRQEVITLHDEYSSRLYYGKNKCLNESSPDDEIIIQNKLDPSITVRSNSKLTTRSNVNSIILREDSEEFECTEL